MRTQTNRHRVAALLCSLVLAAASLPVLDASAGPALEKKVARDTPARSATPSGVGGEPDSSTRSMKASTAASRRSVVVADGRLT